MIGMKQFVAEVSESRDSEVARDDDVGDFTVDLVDSSGVGRLHAHKSHEFVGLFGNKDEDDSDEDDDTDSTFLTQGSHIPVADCGESDHDEVYHIMERGLGIFGMAVVLLVLQDQLMDVGSLKGKHDSTGDEDQSDDGEHNGGHLSTDGGDVVLVDLVDSVDDPHYPHQPHDPGNLDQLPHYLYLPPLDQDDRHDCHDVHQRPPTHHEVYSILGDVHPH